MAQEGPSRSHYGARISSGQSTPRRVGQDAAPPPAQAASAQRLLGPQAPRPTQLSRGQPPALGPCDAASMPLRRRRSAKSRRGRRAAGQAATLQLPLMFFVLLCQPRPASRWARALILSPPPSARVRDAERGPARSNPAGPDRPQFAAAKRRPAHLPPPSLHWPQQVSAWSGAGESPSGAALWGAVLRVESRAAASRASKRVECDSESPPSVASAQPSSRHDSDCFQFPPGTDLSPSSRTTCSSPSRGPSRPRRPGAAHTARTI